jgi:hypothetical protein
MCGPPRLQGMQDSSTAIADEAMQSKRASLPAASTHMNLQHRPRKYHLFPGASLWRLNRSSLAYCLHVFSCIAACIHVLPNGTSLLPVPGVQIRKQTIQPIRQAEHTRHRCLSNVTSIIRARAIVRRNYGTTAQCENKPKRQRATLWPMSV